MASNKEAPPTIFISSSVYRVKPLLEPLEAVLSSIGYTVWVSHQGTFSVDSSKTALENCLDAVRNCDIFVGLITPFYGSGREKGEISITHQEMRLAIELEKPRWLAAHTTVTLARQLLKQYRFDENNKPRADFVFQKTDVMDDIGVVEMYEDAIRTNLPLKMRKGNWVQEYTTDNEAINYFVKQLGDLGAIRQRVKEHTS